MAYKFVEDSEVNEISESSEEINVTDDFKESFESSFDENRNIEVQEEALDLSLEKIQSDPLDLSLQKSSVKVKFFCLFYIALLTFLLTT